MSSSFFSFTVFVNPKNTNPKLKRGKKEKTKKTNKRKGTSHREMGRNDALLERISSTPKASKKKATTTTTTTVGVRRSRRLGPSVSIVGDTGDGDDETPMGKIRETAPKTPKTTTLTTTTTTSRLKMARGKATSTKMRSPLMDRGNERDVVI